MLFHRPKRLQSITVTDPIFGSLTNADGKTWSGRVWFEPLRRDIDVAFWLQEESPPDDRERQFFQSVERNWTAIYARMKAVAFSDLALADGTVGAKIFEKLRFECLFFLDCRQSPRIWEIAATTPLDDHLFAIRMEEFDYLDYRMDG